MPRPQARTPIYADPQRQAVRASQETTTGHAKPVAERKPVFDLDSLTRDPMAGDGFGALARYGATLDDLKRRTIRLWHSRGAGLRELCRITGCNAATVQAALTELAHEVGPLEPETRDELSTRLQAQLDAQRTDLVHLAATATKESDRIAAHRALLLLARTHADIAGLHRTQDTELARSIEALLAHDGTTRVAIAIEHAHADDRKDQNEGARLHRSQAAAERKHYRPPVDATIDNTDAPADDSDL